MSRPPKLTGAILQDEDALHAALDAVLGGTRELRRLSGAVLRAQESLRKSVGVRAWQRYLAVEEATNARNTAMLEAVARWALRQRVGRRRD